MKTAIVTDTNSNISAEEAAKNQIFLLPMPIIIDDKTYLEGIDIDIEKLFNAFKEERSVSTSQPSPTEVTALWDSILAKGYDEILHIPMTSGLSGTCDTAMMLAKEYNGKVYVVDNKRVTVTQRDSVMEALHMSSLGHTAAQIKAHLESTSSNAGIYLAVETLTYLQRGGRLSSSAATLGNILNIKPVLCIRDGQVDVFAKIRGLKKCEKKMLEAIQEDIDTKFADVPVEKIRISAAGSLLSEAEVSEWISSIKEAFPGFKVNYYPLPCSLATHIGPNGFGIAVSVSEY